jgi:hypothetical protein
VTITKTVKHKTLSPHQYFDSMRAFWKQDKKKEESAKKVEEKKEQTKLYRMCERHGRLDLYKPLYDTVITNLSMGIMDVVLSFIEEGKDLEINYKNAGFLTLWNKDLEEKEKLTKAKDYFERSLKIFNSPQLTIVLGNLEDAYKILWDVWYLPE